MNTDLEMEEAQNQYEQNLRKKAESQKADPTSQGNQEAAWGPFVDEDDIPMAEEANELDTIKDPNDYQIGPGSKSGAKHDKEDLLKWQKSLQDKIRGEKNVNASSGFKPQSKGVGEAKQ